MEGFPGLCYSAPTTHHKRIKGFLGMAAPGMLFIKERDVKDRTTIKHNTYVHLPHYVVTLTTVYITELMSTHLTPYR